MGSICVQYIWHHRLIVTVYIFQRTSKLFMPPWHCSLCSIHTVSPTACICRYIPVRNGTIHFSMPLLIIVHYRCIHRQTENSLEIFFLGGGLNFFLNWKFQLNVTYENTKENIKILIFNCPSVKLLVETLKLKD